jgi:hypothetical protein
MIEEKSDELSIRDAFQKAIRNKDSARIDYVRDSLIRISDELEKTLE